MCMCCGILACVECCGKEVFDAAKRDMARVCDHCFRFSSRINHPKRVSIATEDGLPSWASGEAGWPFDFHHYVAFVADLADSLRITSWVL